jgi:protein-tyrosine phosphatase
MTSSPRLLPLVGAYNFRDLGGYPTGDGRFTAWRRLYRSDTLHALTESDLEVLGGLGLASVIDLRTSAEVERSGRGLLATTSLRYLHLSVIGDGGTADSAPEGQEGLAQRYLWYLDVGRRALVDALTAVGDVSSYPLVFHCAAGKDRTGVLAALVLDILGVEQSVIVEDYVLTASRMDLIASRFRAEADAEVRIAEIPQFLLRAESETMETFLDQLYRLYGGARPWALAAGVLPEALSAMTASLVVDIGEPPASGPGSESASG